MIVSLNELDVTVRKAFRGAGYHWGEAEEAGKAAVWLVRWGLPAVGPVLDLLNAASGNIARLRPVMLDRSWASPCGEICPLLSGIALADGMARIAAGDSIALEGLRSPLLVLPFLSQAACGTGLDLTLAAPGFEVTAAGADIHISGPLVTRNSPIAAMVSARAHADSSSPIKVARHHCAEISSAEWEALNQFAAQTYVPASERSRIAGAGAGLADND